MSTLVFIKPHRYNGKVWRKGQMVEVPSDHALVLTALGVAVAANALIMQPNETRQLDDFPVVPGGDVPKLAQQDYSLPVKRPRGRPRKNTYQTRAMVAETPVVTGSVEATYDDATVAWANEPVEPMTDEDISASFHIPKQDEPTEE